jgi:RNA polymerase sigma-70 factor
MLPHHEPHAIERVRRRLMPAVRVRFSLSLEDLAARVIQLAAGQLGDVDDIAGRLVADDLYLATACAAGDDRAWEEFGARYFTFVRQFAHRTLRDPQASDVADQVIADLWQRRKIARYEGRSTLKTWLGAVVAHAAINAATQARAHAARQAEQARTDARTASEACDPAIVGDARDRLAHWVADAIRGLAPVERSLLLLYYEQGLTLDEISPIARRSKAALSRRLDRIRQTLRASIDRRARNTTGHSADAVRFGVDLGRVELDLSALVRRREENRRDVV